ncbi:quinone-dependent dihydroorotate dehydrogenase [Parapedobacter sp. GCM10030251]|uniref:quinone-dependent dihydroorotate dehydrogenase n=1 Tax=Parapedobacter sp. GCM10030251 TaxID=3273419 RepID=UPI003609D786
MYKLVKPILFSLDPEEAHHLVSGGLRSFCKVWGGKRVLKSIYAYEHPKLARNVFGLTFKNPIGLAAGFDKNAAFVEEMDALGFGFVEIGTVTPKPQPGNERPRLFRLVNDKALINRMGFNNQGVDVAANRLRHLKKHTSIVVGGNIGKNKTTTNEDAVKDYIVCFDTLFDVVDYFVVNVSSPNTPGLRALQDKEPLMRILNALQQRNQKEGISRPILLKIAPDLTDGQLDDIIAIVQETGIAGIVATNTTVGREGLKDVRKASEAGGLSGVPLTKRSTDIIRYLSTHSNQTIPIIGVGGIHKPEDALEKLDAGAALIQLYTGFIYEGPALIKQIGKKIAHRS